MKILVLSWSMAVILCLLFEGINSTFYETIGKGLLNLGGHSGATTTVLRRSNDDDWGRGDAYEQHSDGNSQRRQQYQRGDSNKDNYGVNRNNGRRDNSRSGGNDDGERSRWE